jgi:hypothetical protein
MYILSGDYSAFPDVVLGHFLRVMISSLNLNSIFYRLFARTMMVNFRKNFGNFPFQFLGLPRMFRTHIFETTSVNGKPENYRALSKFLAVHKNILSQLHTVSLLE